TSERSVDVDSENPDIVAIAEGIAEPFGEIWPDHALAQIGIVAKFENRIAFFRSIGPAIIHLLKKTFDPADQHRRAFDRHHTQHETPWSGAAPSPATKGLTKS